MAEFGKQAQVGTGLRSESLAIDEGLRSYMLRVYNFMALGVAFTAIVTLFTMSQPQLFALIAAGPAKWVLFAAILGMGFFAPRIILSGSPLLAHGAFWLYAALWGLLIAPMVFFFFKTGAGNLVFRALAITAVTFGAMSLFGYVTKKDLSGWASFLVMASIGLLIAIVVNAIFFQSTMMSLVTSALVVLVFSAITAWETQSIKEMYINNPDPENVGSLAIFGAFILYGSFVTLFIHILNILGILDD